MKLLIFFLIIFIIYLSFQYSEGFNDTINEDINMRNFGTSNKNINDLPVANKEPNRFSR